VSRLFPKTTENAIYIVYVLPYLCKQPYSMQVDSVLTGGWKYKYVITNSTNLANDLTKLELHENHSLITFDIKDLYINIPVSENLNIVKAKLLQNNDTQIAQQVLSLLKEMLSQNYFTFQQRIYQPEQGIAMRSPIASIIAEISI